MDKTGNIIIEDQFELTRPFINGLAKVRLNNKWGYINRQGELIWFDYFEAEPPQWKKVY